MSLVRFHHQRHAVAVAVLLFTLGLDRADGGGLRGYETIATASTRITASIEDPGGSALAGFYQALTFTAQRQAVTRILHYGDSHVAADLMTGALRRSLAGSFGDAGPGFVLPVSQPYRGGSVQAAKSDGWKIEGRMKAELNARPVLGLAGLALSTEQSGEWITITAQCASIDIYLLAQPSGGEVEILLDGASYRNPINVDDGQIEARYVLVNTGHDGSHSIEIKTIKRGRVELLGIVAEQGLPGITYDALGINGARASRPLSWGRAVLESNIQRRDPDLIVIAYGTNEVGDPDLDLAEYGHRFRMLLDLFRKAAPRASLLVIGPPDRAVRIGRRWQTINRMRALVSVQRRAALDAGAAFFDLFAAMGGEGSIQTWAIQHPPLAQPDRVHLTAAGYRIVADALEAELMNGYFEHLSLINPWSPDGQGAKP